MLQYSSNPISHAPIWTSESDNSAVNDFNVVTAGKQEPISRQFSPYEFNGG